MKLRESGMPEESHWEKLLDVELILRRLKLDGHLGDAVELGCGYGTFTIPVAQRISGVLRTYDIDADKVERTSRRAESAGLRNVICEQRDVFEDGFGVANESQDACLLFNILHCEEPVRLLREAARVIRPNGFAYVIHWRLDPATPRGPNLEIRPRPEQLCECARLAGLPGGADPVIDLPPWHYGIRFQKERKHHSGA
jgi:SAM-dependent methyltransferase